MRCVLDVDSFAKREQQISRLLNPLAPQTRRLSCRRRLQNRMLVLSAFLGTEPGEPDPQEWRFATRVPRIRASYYEHWLPTDFRQRSFYLERAYLHLYVRQDDRVEKEIIALHCDPNEAASNKHYLYKAGPHVHMTTAENPLHHAHIALNSDDLDSVLASVQELTSALGTAVKMLNDQVLGLY